MAGHLDSIACHVRESLGTCVGELIEASDVAQWLFASSGLGEPATKEMHQEGSVVHCMSGAIDVCTGQAQL